MEVIHLWSAPRSLSTTVMYSFAQRDDIEVLDEPLYANFLRVTAVHRPYKEELLSKMESDGNKVVKDIIYRPGNSKYRFCKHMSKQRILGLPEDLMKKGKHFILIRNPLDILPSFDEVVPPSFFELGLAELVCIYNELCEIGKPPPVVDAAELQQDPEATLRALCNDLEIPFQPAMLNWEAGPKPIDGLWAPWWYKTVHKSTGFKEENKYPQPFPFSLYNLLEQSLPLYNMLRRHVKKKPSLLGTPLPTPDLPVPANEKLLAWVGNEIVPRESAKVSVFDSVVQGGDSVWEGLRVYNGKIFKLEEHLDRMFDSAKALAFENVPTRDKVTSGMSPTLNLYGCTLIVLAEWKPPVYDNEHGIVLVTATTRLTFANHNNFTVPTSSDVVYGLFQCCGDLTNNQCSRCVSHAITHLDNLCFTSCDGALQLDSCFIKYDNATFIEVEEVTMAPLDPHFFLLFLIIFDNNLDSKIHHNNLLNNILAKLITKKSLFLVQIEGNNAKADDAIMLDKDGYVSETNATNMFIVKRGAVLTPHADYCLPGITRATVMDLVVKEQFILEERRISLSEVHTADEVVKVDGRIIGNGKVGPVTRQLQAAYRKLTEQLGVPISNYLEA
ncbi:hypothetical protein JHK82_028287 [Glycine max]|nr:hypothetical protein JHK85_028959 [Glycine max]KAG5127452.1 hypothetical protein JHK82_028287 [Glycine max]